MTDSVVAAVLLLVSLAMLVIGKTYEDGMGHARMALVDVVAPVVSVIAAPVDAVTAAGKWMNDMLLLHEENATLRSENARLRHWRVTAAELESENTILRTLLRFAPAGKSAYTSARIVADTGSPYARSAIITSGADQGVQEDLAVINENGLVGRVLEVGKRTARVLLLTDTNSRIPVVAERSRERAIASGGDGDKLSLLYLPENSRIAEGETVVTSGDGGVLPPGLPVGVVIRAEKGTATVRPFVDWYHLEYVSVIDFSM